MPLTSRLRELLADAGPGITITPTTHGGRTIVADEPLSPPVEQITARDPVQRRPAPPPRPRPQSPPPAPNHRAAGPIAPAPSPQTDETPASLAERNATFQAMIEARLNTTRRREPPAPQPPTPRQSRGAALPTAAPPAAKQAATQRPAVARPAATATPSAMPPAPGRAPSHAPDLPLPHMPRAVVDKLDTFAAERPPADAAARTTATRTAAPRPQPPPPKPAPAQLASPAPSQAAATRTATTGGGEIRAAIMASRPAFIGIGVFSLVINLLMLTGPLFMLQVYDRVIPSGSLSTLAALGTLTAVLYAMIGLFELIRTRVIARVGVEIDQRLSDRILKASLRRSLLKQGASIAAMRELDTVRQFASGPAPMTFFDAPWTPLYLLVIFMVHWLLGLAALVGAALILVLALASERNAREPLAEANKAAARSLEMTDSAQRNVEALAAMGMVDAYRQRWQKINAEALSWQITASDRIGGTASVSKAMRLLLQSLMLAVGAALAVSGQISAGAIIAGTIIFGRALAPVEQAVGQWRSFIKARESYTRLEQLLTEEPEPPPRTALPPPAGNLDVAQLRVAAPDTRKLILANLNFHVRPGQLLAVIGPSASGKSTLARTLVGLWPPFSGTIRIDGADINQWNPDALGRHLGYLPQDVELFAGTVRDNICRFRNDASDEAVIDAAQMAHAHDMILALPQGYDTQLGSYGTYLSAGQRQRIGLARALFGDPALVVLDEPNANLDRLGDEALASALAGMKARGQAVVLVSHRVQAIGIADTLLYVDRGIQRAFGPRAEVMKLFQGQGGGQGGNQGGERASPGRPAGPDADA